MYTFTTYNDECQVGNVWKNTASSLCKEGLTTSVKRLLSIRNINVNLKDVSGDTPLHWAAYNGHVEIARLLLQNGADVNAINNVGSTPLHYAAGYGHIDILHLLVTFRSRAHIKIPR